jgi:microcystin-dependent protein
MSNPFVAEIRIFGFNFAPTGWAFCDGQLVPISQNTALFSLLGTTYGGNGQTTFALPNMQARAPMHWGQGPGLSLHDLGESGGTQSVSLLTQELPSHSHSLSVPTAAEARADRANAYNNVPANPADATYAPNGAPTQMSPQATAPAGSSLPHNNMQPYLTLNFCIALQGVFPPRS